MLHLSGPGYIDGDIIDGCARLNEASWRDCTAIDVQHTSCIIGDNAGKIGGKDWALYHVRELQGIVLLPYSSAEHWCLHWVVLKETSPLSLERSKKTFQDFPSYFKHCRDQKYQNYLTQIDWQDREFNADRPLQRGDFICAMYGICLECTT